MRTFPLDNYYAHPVEGLHALIDLGNLEILRVDDHFEENGDYIPVPRTPLNYDAELLTSSGRPPRRSTSCSPKAPGFRVDGRKVTWENWDFRVGFNGREGLVLHTIGYTHRRQAPARSSTAPRSPKWSCRTARRSAATTARTCSTTARSASAAWPIR